MIWNKKGKLNVLGIALCFALVGIGVATWDVIWNWHDFKGAYLVDRTQFQTVKGKIIQSSGSVSTQEPRLFKKRIVYQYLIRYEYVVNGKALQSEELDFARNTSQSIDWVNANIDKYPLNAEVIVYYDPSDPAFAVLEPERIYSIAGIAFLFAFISFILAGLIWLHYRLSQSPKHYRTAIATKRRN